MNTFIKYIIRVAGALCILGALAIMFFTTWIKVDDVERKDLRTIRDNCVRDIDDIREVTLQMVEIDRYKDDLKESDVPYQKAEIKSKTKKAEELVKTVLDDSISLKELFTVSAAMPGILSDAENLLSTTFCADIVFNQTLGYSSRNVEKIAEPVAEYSFAFYLIIIFLCLMVLLGVAAAVLHVIHKATWVKYLFAAYVLILTVALFVAMPLLSEALQNGDLPKKFEDISFRVTIMPILATLLSIVPIVLTFVFKKKEQPTA